MRTLGNVLIYAGLGLALLMLVLMVLDSTGDTTTTWNPATIFLWLGVALLGWIVRVISKWEKSLSRQ